MARSYSDIKMCNCAGCSRVLIGACERAWLVTLPDAEQAKLPPLVARRVHGRPVCAACVSEGRTVPPVARAAGAFA